MGKINPPSSKELKAIAHEIANLNRDQSGRMMAVAVKGNEKVRGFSGAIAGAATPQNPAPAYLLLYSEKVPWRSLNPAAVTNGRPFTTCAEAHVWLELMARGKNPSSYTLVSFNADDVIASPCANCAQWVDKAFGSVYKETPHYEGRTRQRP